MSGGQIKVIKYFIKNAPVGEVKDVLDDISTIVGNADFLQHADIKAALRDYYEQHMKHLPLPDGNKAIITAAGRQDPIQREIPGSNDEEGEQEKQYEVEEFVYYDPVQKLKFSFHPVTLDAKIEQQGDLGEPNEGLKNDLIQELEKYEKRQFRQNTTRFSVFMSESHVDISISCHNLNFNNFWGGEWLSHWKVDLNSGVVSGQVKLHNHYFEQGNIQFNMKKDDLSGQLKDVNAKSIVDLIDKLETQYQNGLDQMYESVSQNLLKGMRRIMTVVGTRFDWTRPNLV